MTPASDLIKFTLDVPQIFCPKFVEGKSVHSNYEEGRQMFTAVDGRKVFVNDDEARTLVEGMRYHQIRPGEDFVRVTKRKTRGGAQFLQVERAEDDPDESGTLPVPAPPPPRAPRTPAAAKPAYGGSLEAKLTDSVRIAREHGAAAFITPKQDEPQRIELTPAAVAITAALCAAVDAALEAQAYAVRRGLELRFTEESIRCIGATIFINQQGAKR
jgi:hypothetical protein